MEQEVSPPRMSRWSQPPEHDDGDWPIDRGRPLGMRLLALVGAFSFVMLGLSSLAPLLHPPQREAPATDTGPIAFAVQG